MRIINKISLKIKDFDIKVFIKNKICKIQYFFNQIKVGAPLPLIVIFYFNLGAFITSYHIDIPKWIGAGAAIFSAWIAYCGLKFAKSIFHREYSVTSSHVYNFQSPLDSSFIVNFINRSRINTSVRFIGAIISNSQLIHNPNIKKSDFIDLFPKSNTIRFPRKYFTYLDTLTNIQSFNSISFKVPIRDLVAFMNENPNWNRFVNNIFKDPRSSKPFKIRFFFIDYDNKILSTVDKVNPSNDIYECMRNNFHPMTF